MRYSFGWESESGFCCGVVELGQFTDSERAWRRYDDEDEDEETEDDECYVEARSKKELWKKVFKQMTKKSHLRSWEEGKAAFVHIWFKKPRGRTKYEFSELKKLFSTNPNVYDLGSYINPNTQNRIQGYGVKISGR